jgi:predicted permease
LNNLSQDLRYGVRMLLKRPGFTAIALLSLALGIGANTAIFSVVNAVLLRALPYKNPDSLVRISAFNQQRGINDGAFSFPRFLHMREQNHVFEDISVYMSESFNLTGAEEPEQIQGARVSASLFNILGVSPKLGRTFLPEEDQPGGSNVAVLSHSLWRRRFNSDPNLIGKAITLSGSSFIVIGVMPENFQFPYQETHLWATKVFETNRFTPEQIRSGAGFLIALARLKSNTDMKLAQSDMDLISRNYQQQNPSLTDADPNAGIRLVLFQNFIVQDIRLALLVVFGAVGLVLLIACANVANLLLARATTRQREIAIRAALGASRFRIIRQLLTESLLLSVIGGFLGLLLTTWCVDLIVAANPNFIPRVQEISIDRNVLFFSLLISALTGTFFGIAPAIRMSSPVLNEALKEGGRGAETYSRNWTRSLLVVSEVSLSLVLLIGAGLLIQSFIRLQSVNTGFNSENLLTMYISLSQSKYPENNNKTAFFNQVLERIESIPGVQAAGASLSIPPQGNVLAPYLLESGPQLPPGERPLASWSTISPGYLKTMNIPLLKGRQFTEQDLENSQTVAIINESMARSVWPNEDPIGKRMTVGRMTKPSEIVGIVVDVKNAGLEAETRSQIYTPYPQRPWAAMNIVVRTTGDPLSLTSAIRSQVFSVDKEQPVIDVQTMDQILSNSISQRRLTMYLLGMFAILALVLAFIGIYGVIAYSVTQRMREIGVRMALGAQKNDVLKLVIVEGMKPAIIGILLGLVIALSLTRLISSMLFGISAIDPATFTVISALLSIVALFACYIPAHRAASVDPMVALRNE